ncbi:MAG: glutamyl-tRNA reductase [Chloroflexi bacterium]|nr:glutamyl-tRNA reductase [Chloroflexota bacterium]
MVILAVGMNHKTAPLEVREKVALGSGQLEEALGILPRFLPQGVILSTCNRTEVYTISDGRGEGRRQIQRFLSRYHQASQRELAPFLFCYQEEEAIRHLFQVACGMDSMVFGEAQILGQVRQALAAAAAADACGPHLSRLFQAALRAGRLARAQTGIGHNSVSVSSIGVALARQTLGGLDGCTALVISAGETGTLTAKNLVDGGVSQVLVTSRTYERACQLAHRWEGRAVPFEDLEEALEAADIVITSTGAKGHILGPQEVGTAMRNRRTRPLFVLDIAVPRDVDPLVATIDNVFLYDIDDLQAISETNLKVRQREAEKAQPILEREVARFMRWWNSRGAVPTIVTLRRWAETVRSSEVEKTLSRLDRLSPQEQERIAAMSRSLVNKLLHTPTRRLKEGRGKTLPIARELFALEEDSPLG